MNCRLNEEKVFPSLLEQLDSGFIEARLHTDGEHGEELTDFQEELAGSIATPLYLVLDPTSEKVLAGPVGGVVSVSGFSRFLEGARERGPVKVGRLDER